MADKSAYVIDMWLHPQEMQRPFFNVSAPEIVTGMSGQSEAKIRKLFASARVCSVSRHRCLKLQPFLSLTVFPVLWQAEAPSIIFIDEIDAVAPRRVRHRCLGS